MIGPLAIIFMKYMCVRCARHFICLIAAFRAVKSDMRVLCAWIMCMDFCLCVVRLRFRLLFKVNSWVQWIINIVDYNNDKFPTFAFRVYKFIVCVCVCFSKLWAIKYKNNNRKTNRIVQIISHFITPVLLNSQISGSTQIHIT